MPDERRVDRGGVNGPLWFLTKDGDRSCRELFRRHYSCRDSSDNRSPIFVGPGQKVVLRTDAADAMFVWRHSAFRRDGQEGIECAVFRNEGQVRSSELIRQADEIADLIWPDRRHYTFVRAENVRSSNPGFCFIAAGWRRCGMSASGLVILERTPITYDGPKR